MPSLGSKTAAKVQDLPIVLEKGKKGLLTVEDGRFDLLQLSRSGRPPKKLLSTPLRYFLYAHLSAPIFENDQRRLDLHLLICGKGKQWRLTKLHVLVEGGRGQEGERWVEYVMGEAYRGSKPRRRILLLVNPYAGKGKGKQIVKEVAMPVLEAAGCYVDIEETKYRGHAEEIAQKHDLNYDAIATASGDGIIYEVLNGLASRPDGKRALQTPIVPIPTGSANSLNLCLQGVADVFDIHLACLNAIKGIVTPIDLMSVMLLPSGKRRLAFLSLGLGLTYDWDIGTEHLRWMGDVRFKLGAIRGFILRKNTRCRVHMKVVESDKLEMIKHARERVKDQDEARINRQAQRPSLTRDTEETAAAPPIEGPAESPPTAYHTPTTTTPLSVDSAATRSTAQLNNMVGAPDDGTGPFASPSTGPAIGDPKSDSTSAPLADTPTVRNTNPSEAVIAGQNGDREDAGGSSGFPGLVVAEHEGGLPEHEPLEPDSTWRMIETRSNGASQATKATGLASKVGPSATAEHKGTWHDGEGLLYLYAGLMPWADRDLLQWPVATSGQGVIDCVFQSIQPRATLIGAISSAATGEQYWHPSQHYYKATALVIENLDKERQPEFALDGEGQPWDRIHVQVMSQAANVLSLEGHFFVPDFLRNAETRE